jgi:hypothetical protein
MEEGVAMAILGDMVSPDRRGEAMGWMGGSGKKFLRRSDNGCREGYHIYHVRKLLEV